MLLAALCAAPVLAQSPNTGRVASSSDIQTKVSLESLLEKRLETVLRKVLGAEDVFVVANAELLAESDRPDVEVLPGVTVKTTPATAAPLELPASLVKRITISVFVNRSMSDDGLALAKKTTERMVGLKPERGDVLNVERVGATANPAVVETYKRFLDESLQPRILLSVAGLIVACWGLLFLSRKFFDPFIGVLRDAANSLQHLSTPDVEAVSEPHDGPMVAVEEGVPPPPPPVREEPPEGRKVPFSFLNDRDQPALELLIAELSDINASIVVQYLPPNLASRLLSGMALARRETILGYMSRAALMNQTEVRALEETIRAKIDFIMGGEDKLANLIESSPIAMQAAIMTTVAHSNPDMARRLEARVVSVEDIGRLDEQGLTALSRIASVRGMAIVLKFIPGLREKVLPRLTSGLGDWLAQETGLIGDLTPMVKEAEMQKVLTALGRLVKEGKIAIKRTAPPPVDGH